MPREVNSDKAIDVIAELREAIKVQMEKNNPLVKHRIVLVGDSLIRGYACSLRPLLGNSFDVYGVVKPGSDTNELLNSAKDSIELLNHDDMLVFCYGSNDLDQEMNYSCTFQNIKKFMMENNHTNILVINLPARYELTNSDYANRNLLRLNRKLQKLFKINPHSKFLVTSKEKNYL